MGIRLFVFLKRVAHEPEHRWPEPDEQCAPLRVAALVLVDGLGANPQGDAEPDARKRRGLQVPAADTGVVKTLGQHGARLPGPAGRDAAAGVWVAGRECPAVSHWGAGFAPRSGGPPVSP